MIRWDRLGLLAKFENSFEALQISPSWGREFDPEESRIIHRLGRIQRELAHRDDQTRRIIHRMRAWPAARSHDRFLATGAVSQGRVVRDLA